MMDENDTVQMWEYVVTSKPDTKGFMAWLNNYGAAGWELVQIIDMSAPGESGYYRLFWKRPYISERQGIDT